MRFPLEQKKYHFHFVGLGGIGMSALAYALATLGHLVTGSDIKADFYTKKFLENAGVTIYVGHSADNISDSVDIGVISTAIDPNNPEIVALKSYNKPIVHRSQILGAFSKVNTTIGVTGSHGKTTLTYYIARILLDALLDPSIIIGATVKELLGNNARVGGNMLVAEIDESDKSLLNIFPDYAVIHSIDLEHMDHYGSYEEIYNTFVKYALKVPWWGYSFFNVGYKDLSHMSKEIEGNNISVVRYGLLGKYHDVVPDYVGDVNLERNEMTIYKMGTPITKLSLKYPTYYNFENALAAFAVAHTIGIGASIIVSSLENASMPGRRLEHKGYWKGALVLEDYAHHPREIEMLLDGIRSLYPGYKVVGVLQPHRYSRVKALWDDFRRVIRKFDRCLVMPIYPANEHPIDGVTSENLINGIENSKLVNWNNIKDLLSITIDELGISTVVVLIGAGDVYKVWSFLSNK